MKAKGRDTSMGQPAELCNRTGSRNAARAASDREAKALGRRQQPTPTARTPSQSRRYISILQCSSNHTTPSLCIRPQTGGPTQDQVAKQTRSRRAVPETPLVGAVATQAYAFLAEVI